ncbi:MAG: hypothetical protein DMG73_16345 [Acidobacteria bacterium]|nr:MAG: hypothetical protein DMG73_16345 [Acidobacteriota bacterium]PYX62910.1 MAG: hypothetical protein DMG74_18965 [Acidobacteriota bacterium]
MRGGCQLAESYRYATFGPHGSRLQSWNVSAFGPEHAIRALIQNGTFDEDNGTVDFVVDARTLRVLDSDVSDKDRAEIQITMVGPKVLDTSQFHEIRFHSTEVGRGS